jgi:NAD(P)-dependent dehydrogenase (short-subunit alcohol dehydrogenase family)
MREQRHGRIVMTHLVVGSLRHFGQANYGAAKMALVGLMQTLAIEGEKYGIRVNCLAPTRGDADDARRARRRQPRPARSRAGQPRLLALVGPEAPTRTVLCAGAGHFASAMSR